MTQAKPALNELFDVTVAALQDQHVLYWDADTSAWSNISIGTLLPVGVTWAVAVKTSAYTLAAADVVLICNSAGGYTQPLPAATGSGRVLYIKNIGAGAIVLDGDASDTIDGNETQTLYQWEAVGLVDYAANAWIAI